MLLIKFYLFYSVLQNIADARPKVRYLIAKDDAQNTLEEIVKSVSSSLGTGKVKQITKEEALLSKDIEVNHNSNSSTYFIIPLHSICHFVFIFCIVDKIYNFKI